MKDVLGELNVLCEVNDMTKNYFWKAVFENKVVFFFPMEKRTFEFLSSSIYVVLNNF